MSITTPTRGLAIGPMLLILLLIAPTTGGGQGAPPGIAEALRIQPKDPAAAAKILEGVTAREPKNARAWRLLGTALQQSGQLDRALEAYQRTLALQSDATAMYNIGTVHAIRNQRDAAFEWLGKAKATRQFDMSFLQVDPDVASLKGDPRFAAILPAPADFADPFVEQARIIREWRGEALQDQFGWIARGIGDADDDGVQDVVTSAPTHAIGGKPAGRVYAYSSKTGRLLWKADGAPGERLGISVEAAGDVDRDGAIDVVASAPGTGRAYVFAGKDGRVIRTLTSGEAGVNLGAVATAGDVNGDGYADILAGAPPPPQGGQGAGTAFVFSGKDGTVLFSLAGEREGDRFGAAVAGHSAGKATLLAVGAPGAGPRKTGRVSVFRGPGAPAFTIDSDETGAALGAMFVAIAGDVDADGVPDVYASDFTNRAKGPSTGRVYVHSGKTGERLLTLTGASAGEALGTSASTAGDLDGDGHADLAVGAWQHASAAPSGGRIYVYSGKDGALLRTITCRIPGDTLGFDSVAIGDVDGDGRRDLLITSAYSGVNGYRSGRVFIVAGEAERARR
jgi:hypothetical protein